jgi:hypothetical protein
MPPSPRLPAMKSGADKHTANLLDRVGKCPDLVPLGEGLEAEARMGLPVLDDGFWLPRLLSTTFDFV